MVTRRVKRVLPAIVAALIVTSATLTCVGWWRRMNAHQNQEASPRVTRVTKIAKGGLAAKPNHASLVLVS